MGRLARLASTALVLVAYAAAFRIAAARPDPRAFAGPAAAARGSQVALSGAALDCREVCTAHSWRPIGSPEAAGAPPHDFLCIVFHGGLTYYGHATAGRCSYYNQQLRRSISTADYSCACTQSSRVSWAPAEAGCEPPAGSRPAVAAPAACRIWKQGSRDPADTVMGYLLSWEFGSGSGSRGSSSSSGGGRSGGSSRSSITGSTCFVHRAMLGPAPWWSLGWGAPQILEAAEVGGPNRVDVLCRGPEPAADA